MEASDVRRAFTRFFEERDHTRVPSASLIPHDPALLFTVAGMVPFIPYFTGVEPAPYKRAVSVQKCVRAGGKHNDLDEIGRTNRHLSFFEMLGNFSFGDYFKQDAIPWAWELITEVLGFDAELLWVTVHLSDDEAEQIWLDDVGIKSERVQRLDEDNYWRMADTGPCGPSSEIFIDLGPAYGAEGGPAHGGEERFVELWNLVFMQFDQQADGTQVPLPAPSIDTGAGLERILAILQGVESVFQIDEMVRLLDKAAELSGVPVGRSEATDVSLRILAEHARTMTFLISDGVFPSNEHRGYVLRRIMRRAIRHAYLLGVDEVITPALVDEVVDTMGPDYPDVVTNRDFVRGVVEREEERFRRTLRAGSTILEEQLAEHAAGDVLPGEVAFQLHDTYGFPIEVTEEIVSERGLTVDQDGFDREMAAQRQRAKDARRVEGDDRELGPFLDVLEEFGPTDFLRADDTAEARVLLVVDDGIILDRTPFYAESGGQEGDIGTIVSATGTAVVGDTTYVVPGLHLHHIESADGRIEAGQPVTASIDSDRRSAIRRNHTGTHILHWALRKVLGDHVKQQGSLVAPDRLRFDFSHYDALTADQIQEIEDIANHEILDNGSVRHYETSIDTARELGAIAFFGEKYGDIVRVLEAGRNSIELCGGTHVRSLGEIGPLKITSEGSIGSNLRRIEAVTGYRPIELLRAEEERAAEAAGLLGVPPDDLLEGIEKRLAQMADLQTELRTLRRQVTAGRSGDLVGQAVDGVVVARVDGIGRDELRDMALSLRDQDGVRGVVLGSAPDSGGVALVAAVASGSGLHAGELIADAAKAVRGGGGKGEELAVAGGKDADQLDAALDLARQAAGIG